MEPCSLAIDVQACPLTLPPLRPPPLPSLPLPSPQGCPPFLFYFRFVGESDAPLSLSNKRQVSQAVQCSAVGMPAYLAGNGAAKLAYEATAH